MRNIKDGPATDLFKPLPLKANNRLQDLARMDVSEEMKSRINEVPEGACVCWGIPFLVKRFAILRNQPIVLKVPSVKARWFVFMHTSDISLPEWNDDGFLSPMSGEGRLNEEAARYTVEYEDGNQITVSIRRRHQIGTFKRRWGENCFEAVADHRPHPIRSGDEKWGWGTSQKRVTAHDAGKWVNWLWAWENPQPDTAIRALCLEPISGTVILSAVSTGDVSSHPLRWNSRRKARLILDADEHFDWRPDDDDSDVRIDMGQIISAEFRRVYPNESWEQTANNQLPEVSAKEVLLEYASDSDAVFHLSNRRRVPVRELTSPVEAVKPAERRVRLRVVEKGSSLPVPVKLHVHGETGEYLPPIDRHRRPNNKWFEDYSVDFVHNNIHNCTYISGETEILLPVGHVFVEVSKGCEIQPVRRVCAVDSSTDEILIELERVLPWRQAGWVTADTHVHFLSPASALLEGSAEGVNVVNLLASQWGELMTNVGDFDGRTTWGSQEAGGDGEFLVRVGTENRQHVLGHISLLGYEGNLIGPMTTGGPDESALGDPVELLLTDWADKCRRQGGVVVLPHFPNPRAENAVAILSGNVDALEMTSWGDLYSGIDPYSLSDWYRYLNCGSFVAAVGGTDKMSAGTAVGTIRTYARIPSDREFTYDEWKEAVRRGETFVTYGPLVELSVDGKPMGCRIDLPASGGTCEVEWRAESVTCPMSRVDLVVNGEIVRSEAVNPKKAGGALSIKLKKSSWIALLVRGHYPEKPEIIAAHTSPVMVEVEGSEFIAAADALTILEQIEGAMAYLDTIGTRADAESYRRMRMILQSQHRKIHNRMHQAGFFHTHGPVEDHHEHHE